MSATEDRHIAIAVREVSKRFRLYHEKNATLKATILRRGRSRHEEFWALEDVSLEVPEGATFGLIGENGSGKSTLLKCMARILRPDRGEIATRGQVSALLELGAGFHGELSGRENVYLNGSILGLSRRQIDQRFDEIVEFAGGEVPRFIDNPVKNYSSGMFVRLGFAIAINVEPDVLLVDEILAVGDEDFQRKCMEKFSDFRKAGRTVVIVSHALDTLRNLCDQAAWLDHGHLKEIGPAGHVIDAYLDAVSDLREARRAEFSPSGTTGELVHRIELLDAEAQPTTTLRTSMPATVRVSLECGTTGDTEVLRFELNSPDGTWVSRTSTRQSEIALDELAGIHSVEYTIPRVLLAPGEYDLSVVLVGSDGRSEIESHRDALRFEVVDGPVRHFGGYMLLGGEWSVDES